jgi:general secretion pathway protein A
VREAPALASAPVAPAEPAPVEAPCEPAQPAAVAAVETPPAPPPAVAEPPPPAVAEPPPPPLAQRIAGLDGPGSARAAFGVVLGAWHAAGLTDSEAVSGPADFAASARRRKLDDLPLSGNLSMLRLLDLPAILELQPKEASGSRWVALVGIDDAGARISLNGATETIAPADLERVWFGRAHVFWRDFEDLGPSTDFTPNASGGGVRRLQALLHRAGAYGGPDTGIYGPATTAALVEFQRSRLLAADGRLGPLTRIALYGAAGGYARPALAAPAGDRS